MSHCCTRFLSLCLFENALNFLPHQLHLQGKTDEAKADLARLAKVRAEREAAQAKRKAEAEGNCAIFKSLSDGFRSFSFEAKLAEIEAKKKAQQTKRA